MFVRGLSLQASRVSVIYQGALGVESVPVVRVHMFTIPGVGFICLIGHVVRVGHTWVLGVSCILALLVMWSGFIVWRPSVLVRGC